MNIGNLPNIPRAERPKKRIGSVLQGDGPIGGTAFSGEDGEGFVQGSDRLAHKRWIATDFAEPNERGPAILVHQRPLFRMRLLRHPIQRLRARGDRFGGGGGIVAQGVDALQQRIQIVTAPHEILCSRPVSRGPFEMVDLHATRVKQIDG